MRDKGWTPAGELEIGDLLSGEDGQWIPIDDLLDTGEFDTVYNLRVADYHTYFVGSTAWGFSVWVHNAYNGPNNMSTLSTVGGLVAHEGATRGHTILKHVGKRVADLRARLIAQPWIQAASTFYNRRIAEYAINRTIAAKSKDIATWLSGATPKLPLRFDLQTNIGRVLPNGAQSSSHAQKALVVLKRDPNSSLGYFILTAYPE